MKKEPQNKQFAIIGLEGMSFFAYHGVYPEEKKEGNRFRVDLYLKAEVSKASKTDEVGDTVDYANVYSLVKEIMAVRVDLLETLADKIIQSLLKRYPKIRRVQVRVSKLEPRVGGECERSFVEMSAKGKKKPRHA